MPLYEYQCLPNGHRFEVRHGINDPAVESCQECGAPVRRVIHPVGVVFKGSGFYATDSRRSSTASTTAKSEASADAKTETKKDSKPATKPEPSSSS